MENVDVVVDAEHSIIGCILLDFKSCILELLRLDISDFQNTNCKEAYSATMCLYAKNKAVDVTTLLAFLSSSKNRGDVQVFLAQCAEYVPTTSHIREYVNIVLEASKRRTAKIETTNLMRMLETGEPLSTCQEKVTRISEKLNDTKTKRELNASEGLKLIIEKQGQIPNYIPTGIALLDKYLHISKGDYIVIGGRPSTGKTALTIQFMLSMAKQYRVVYFSLETSGSKMYERIISNFAGLPFSDIQKANVDPIKLEQLAPDFENLRFTVVDASGWSVSQIRAKSAELKADVVFIDYLSLVSGKGKTTLERVTNISIDLHVMAQQSETTVIALSQLNRDSGRENRAPTMVDLRESGQVEQDADAILILHNPEKNNFEDKLLSLVKNKSGECGQFNLRFDGAVQRFFQKEWYVE